MAAPQLRIARPVTDLRRAERMYTEGLGLQRLGGFADHQGFDGVMLGLPGAGYHFEFTACRGHPVPPTPTQEDLAVFYLPDAAEWQQRCQSMLAAGFRATAAFNPYWEVSGRTFADADGYRVVLQRAAWPPMNIVPVEVGEAAAVAHFIERVIRASVDASDKEKEDFIVHTGRNVAAWAAAPEAALHLKCTDAAGALQGVVMVKQYWNLCHLFVAPGAQGRGMGRALMEAALAACRERRVRPYVRLNSARNAVGFYEHLGFARVPDAPVGYAAMQFEIAL